MPNLVTLHKIVNRLTLYCFNITLKNQMGLGDEAKLAEGVLGNIFSQIFDLILRDANLNKSNVAGIDLNDSVNKVAVQVTTLNQKFQEKKDSTVKKFQNDPANAGYEQLILIYFTIQKVDADVLDREQLTTTLSYEGYNFKKLGFAILSCDEPTAMRILQILDDQLGSYEELNIIEKPNYLPVDFYIERLFQLPESSKDIFASFDKSRRKSLRKLVEQYQEEAMPFRCLIKADAAMGKSAELDHLACYYTNLDKELLPVKVRLKNFHGDLEIFISKIQPRAFQVRPSELLLLLDGIDDISGQLLTDFIHQFNILMEGHPGIHIVATIRSNVYSKEIGKGVSQGRGLTALWLTELDDWDIHFYIDQRVPLERRNGFYRYVEQTWVKEIRTNPFYLANLVDLYINNEIPMPANKSELIQKFIDLKSLQDKEKYLEDIDIPPISQFARRLALFLTLTGKNSILSSDLSAFTGLNTAMLKRSSLFRIEEQGFDIVIAFSHNNFQEFLAAEKLAELPWNQLEPILFHSARSGILKPKMVNTVNFLFTLLRFDNPVFVQLLNQLVQFNGELLLKFERDKIPPEVRKKLVISLIEKGKAQKIFWLGGDFRAYELAHFSGYTRDIQRYLLEQLDEQLLTQHRLCLLDLLRSMPKERIGTGNRVKITSMTLRDLAQSNIDKLVVERLIDLLMHLEIFDAKLLTLLKNMPLNQHADIRRLVIKYIQTGEFEGEFTYILKSDEVLTRNADRSGIGLEALYFNALSRELDLDHAIELVGHLAANSKATQKLLNAYTTLTTKKPIEEIYSQLATLYNESKSRELFDGYYQFFLSVDFIRQNDKSWRNPAEFFYQTETAEQVFFTILQLPDIARNSHMLTRLFHKDFLPKILTDYKVGIWTNEQLKKLRNVLFAHRHPEAKWVDQELVAFDPAAFGYPTSQEFESLMQNRKKMNIEVLRQPDLFLPQAKITFDLFDEARKTNPELQFYYFQYDASYEVQKQLPNTLLFDVMKNDNPEDGYQDMVTWFGQTNWNDFLLDQVYDMYSADNSSAPPDLLKKAMDHLKLNLLPQIDFQNSYLSAFYRDSNLEKNVAYVVYFFKRGLLDLPESAILDLLYVAADGWTEDVYDEDNQVRQLYQLIADNVPPESFKNRVLANLQNSSLPPIVTTLHARIAEVYHFAEAIPVLMDLLLEANLPEDYKTAIISSLIGLKAPQADFEELLFSITAVLHNWHFKLVEHLMKPQYASLEERLKQLVESSLVEDDVYAQDFWKFELILIGIRLGSKQIAALVFIFLKDRKNLPDLFQVKASSFDLLCQTESAWILDQCFAILAGTIGPEHSSHRHEKVSEMLEEMIRSAAITDFSLVESAIKRYDVIIEENGKMNDDFYFIEWFKRRLIKSYYATAQSYGTDAEAWHVINLLIG